MLLVFDLFDRIDIVVSFGCYVFDLVCCLFDYLIWVVLLWFWLVVVYLFISCLGYCVWC